MKLYTAVVTTLLSASGFLISQSAASARAFVEKPAIHAGEAVQQIAQTPEGVVEGIVGFPSEVKPASLLCAQSVVNLYSMRCINSPASDSGSRVPFSISLAPGDYYLFSYLRDYGVETFIYHSMDGPVYGGDSSPKFVRVRSGQRVSGIAVNDPSTCADFPGYFCITPPANNAVRTTTPESPAVEAPPQQEPQDSEQALICELYQMAADRVPVAGSSWLSVLAEYTGTYDLLELSYGLLAGNVSDCPNASQYQLSQIGSQSEQIAEAVAQAAVEEGVGSAVCKLTSGSGNRTRGGLRGVAASAAQRGINTVCGDNGSPNSSVARSADANSNSGVPEQAGDRAPAQTGLSQRDVNVPITPILPNGVSRNDLSNNTLTANVPKTTRVEADNVNATAAQFGASHPPFIPGTQVNVHVVKEPAAFVRFYGGDSMPQGNFMMRLEDVENLSPAQIRDQFALPPGNTMQNMAIVRVRAGTTLNSGPANAQLGWGRGGGNQYYIDGDFSDIVESVEEMANW